MEKPIFIFYHICLGGPWEIVVKEQLAKLENSGLLDRANGLKCGVLGPKSEYEKLIRMLPDKAEIIFYSENYGLFEFPTVILLQEHALENDGYYLYLHTKSVSRFTQETTDWRHLMEYFTIEKYENALEKLEEGFDCFGVNWRNIPTPHFSGNFWWARSEYLKKLPIILVSGDRFLCEFWIGRSNPKVFCAFESGVDHYYHRCQRSKYEGTPI